MVEEVKMDDDDYFIRRVVDITDMAVYG